MAIKICKYKNDKNDKNDNKDKKYSKYIMSGSGMPGKLRQKTYVASSLSPKNKYRAKVGLGIATGLIVPYGILKGLKKVVTYLPSKGYHYFNDKTESGQTYKEEYGLKNKSHVEKARKATDKYHLLTQKLKNKYGTKIVQTAQGPVKMNIMQRYDYAKSILSSPTISLKEKEKAKLLIKFIDTKRKRIDRKSQKIINYITKKRGENQITTITGHKFDNNTDSAVKLDAYIQKIKTDEEV
jgi:hypothetical protein